MTVTKPGNSPSFKFIQVYLCSKLAIRKLGWLDLVSHFDGLRHSCQTLLWKIGHYWSLLGEDLSHHVSVGFCLSFPMWSLAKQRVGAALSVPHLMAGPRPRMSYLEQSSGHPHGQVSALCRRIDTARLGSECFGRNHFDRPNAFKDDKSTIPTATNTIKYHTRSYKDVVGCILD